MDVMSNLGLSELARRHRVALAVLAEIVLPDTAAAALSELARIGDALVHRVERVERFAPTRAEPIRPVNLQRTIREIVEALRGAGTLLEHQIVYALPDLPVYAMVHRARHEQILVGLLSNAVEAMRDVSGTIMIAVHANVRHARVLVEVSDTGLGIAPAVMPLVFDAFFTTKDRERHVGLGLTRARQAVRDYGGELGVSSAVGVGSTFTFDLPCSERHAQT